MEVDDNAAAADDDDDKGPNGATVAAITKFLFAIVVTVVVVVWRKVTFRNAIILAVISTLVYIHKDFQISAPVVFLLDDLDNLEMQLDSDWQ